MYHRFTGWPSVCRHHARRDASQNRWTGGDQASESLPAPPNLRHAGTSFLPSPSLLETRLADTCANSRARCASMHSNTRPANTRRSAASSCRKKACELPVARVRTKRSGLDFQGGTRSPGIAEIAPIEHQLDGIADRVEDPSDPAGPSKSKRPAPLNNASPASPGDSNARRFFDLDRLVSSDC